MKYSLLFFVYLFCSSITKSQSIDSLDYNISGGISGLTKSHRFTKKTILLAEGNIALKYTPIKKMKKSNWRNISNYSTTVISDTNMKLSTGNITKSIIFYSGEKTYRIKWSISEDDNIPNSLHLLVNFLEKIE